MVVGVVVMAETAKQERAGAMLLQMLIYSLDIVENAMFGGNARFTVYGVS